MDTAAALNRSRGCAGAAFGPTTGAADGARSPPLPALSALPFPPCPSAPTYALAHRCRPAPVSQLPRDARLPATSCRAHASSPHCPCELRTSRLAALLNVPQVAPKQMCTAQARPSLAHGRERRTILRRYSRGMGGISRTAPEASLRRTSVSRSTQSFVSAPLPSERCWRTAQRTRWSALPMEPPPPSRTSKSGGRCSAGIGRTRGRRRRRRWRRRWWRRCQRQQTRCICGGWLNLRVQRSPHRPHPPTPSPVSPSSSFYDP